MSPTQTTATISELRHLAPLRRTDEQVLQDAARWMRFCDRVAISSLARAIGVSTARLRRLVEESPKFRLRDGASVRRHLGLTWSHGLTNPHTGHNIHLVRDEYIYVERIPS